MEQKFEVMTGRPDSAHVQLYQFSNQPLEEELFPQEIEALNILKQYKITKFFNDRFLMGCLFARKMDIQRTVKMLKSNLKWRLANRYERIPRWADIDKTMLLANFACIIPGARSKEGQAILYCNLSKLVPGNMGKNYIRTIVDYVIWNNSIGTCLDGIDFHRNGLIFVIDLRGVGWKNFDINLQRKINSALMDNFPLRIVKVFMLNPPSVVQAMISCVRLFVKKKIMDRIEIATREELLNYVDADQLWTEFGGECEYSIERLIQDIDDYHTNNSGNINLRIHTISKKGKKKNNRAIEEESGSANNLTTSKPRKPKGKKTKTDQTPSETSSETPVQTPIGSLNGINPDEIPEEVLLQLQNGEENNYVESDEETNSFLEKIDDKSQSDQEEIRRSSNSKTRRSKSARNSDNE